MAHHVFFLLTEAGQVELTQRMMADTVYSRGDTVATRGELYTVVRVEHYIDQPQQTRIFLKSATDV